MHIWNSAATYIWSCSRMQRWDISSSVANMATHSFTSPVTCNQTGAKVSAISESNLSSWICCGFGLWKEASISTWHTHGKQPSELLLAVLNWLQRYLKAKLPQLEHSSTQGSPEKVCSILFKYLGIQWIFWMSVYSS